MEQLNNQLNMVRRRLQWFRELAGIRQGCLAGLLAASLLLAAGRLCPIEGVIFYALGSLVLLTAAGWLWGRLRLIPLAEAAREMDTPEAGKERQDFMTTALAFAGDDSLPARLQRKQAEEHGSAYVQELKRRLPPPRRRKGWWVPLAVGALAVVLLSVLPNPMDQVLDQHRKEREWIHAQQEETDKRIQELETKELEPLAKDALSKELADLRQALDRSREPAEALDNVEEAMQRLKEMQEKLDLKQQQTSDWLPDLKNHHATEGLASALEQKDAGNLDQKMDELRQKLPGMTPEERQGLADALDEIAKSAPEGNEDAKRLAEALKQAASAIDSGDQVMSDQALEKLAEALKKQLQTSDSEAGQAEAAAALATALAKQGMGLAEEMAASGLAVSDTWSMGGSAEQLAAGEGGAGGGEAGGEAGSDPGAGQGAEGAGGASSNPGTGAGSGKGTGNGAGTGSGSGSGQGQGQGQGTGQGQGQGAGAGLGSGRRTLVTTPRDLKGAGNVQTDGGPSTGGTVQKGGESPVFDGVSRPYEEVYSDYATEAKRSLERRDLPQSMQSLVENYFTEIDPGP
ncbi:phage tail tape measure protein [Paenibacillus sp. FSL R5-0407]|uniref:phage tail tape measure protein n=1 Tax=Paenibacillus sp. FSL R5-0407 TaxID=2975320 RepID=UPI0030F61138